MQKHRATYIIRRCLVILAAAVVFCACTERDRYIQITGYAQGGTYCVKLNLRGCTKAPAEIQAAVDSILVEIDNTLSGYNKGSQLSRYNRGDALAPNKLFADTYQLSYDLYCQTNGVLDFAAGPVFGLWGFNFDGPSQHPSANAVADTLARYGMKHMNREMQVEEGFPHQRLNFNAIAQGLSCDLVADYLHSIGAHDMLVDIGEIYCEGVNPNGKPWTIGVDTPTDGNETPGKNLSALWHSSCSEGQGLVTSGNYRKFYIEGGKKYSHTIDPRTGYPVQHNLLSATIVAPTAALADAYATYCMVVGLEEMKQFVSSHEELEGLAIYSDSDGQMCIWRSEGFGE